MSSVFVTKPLRAIRPLLVPIASLLILWLWCGPIEPLDFSALRDAVLAFPIHFWVLGGGLSALSFMAVARYDAAVAPYTGLQISKKQSIAAGWRATAIAQMVGFGLFSGALVRWYVLNGGRLRPPYPVSLWTATRQTLFVTLSFFLGWMVVTSLLTAIHPALSPTLRIFGAAGCLASLALFFLCLLPSRRLSRILPSQGFMTHVSVLTLVDTLAAFSIIYLFLPEGYMPFFTLYALFMVAIVAGMVSGLPGGVGPFEVTLLALLPASDPAPMIAALVAYRALYFGLPAMLAGLTLLPALMPAAVAPAKTPRRPAGWIVPVAPPEIALISQGQLTFEADPTGGMARLHRETPNNHLVLGAPFGFCDLSEEMSRLRDMANKTRKGLCFYKANASVAALSRTLGFSVHQIGVEAWINPAGFTLEGRKKRGLRRKLRHAETSGVDYVQAAPSAGAMDDMDHEWRMKRGRAQGFSMGQFSLELIAQQVVFTAYVADEPVAFVSFSTSDNVWALDLMRSSETCPDGTLYGLICFAIDAAKQQKITEINLAAAPFAGLDGAESLVERLAHYAYRKSSKRQGLFQFKSGFDPEWRPVYLVASKALHLPCICLDLWMLIQYPSRPTSTPRGTHHNYENYEFASYKRTCD